MEDDMTEDAQAKKHRYNNKTPVFIYIYSNLFAPIRFCETKLHPVHRVRTGPCEPGKSWNLKFGLQAWIVLEVL